MTRDTVKRLSAKNVFGGKLLRLIDPAPHARLRHAEITRQLTVASGTVSAGHKCFVAGRYDIHEAIYTKMNKTVNENVECRPIQDRIRLPRG